MSGYILLSFCVLANIKSMYPPGKALQIAPQICLLASLVNRE